MGKTYRADSEIPKYKKPIDKSSKKKKKKLKPSDNYDNRNGKEYLEKEEDSNI